MSELNGINSISYLSTIQMQDSVPIKTKLDKYEEAKEDTTINDLAAIYDKSSLSKLPKNKYVTNTSKLEQMRQEYENQTKSFKELFESMIQKQSNSTKLIKQENLSDLFQTIQRGEFVASEEQIKEAKESISNDGYYGIQQTSLRIIEFAKALVGNNISKYEMLTDAINKGFAEASKIWQDDLPEISKKTHEAVLVGLQTWVSSNEEQKKPTNEKERKIEKVAKTNLKENKF